MAQHQYFKAVAPRDSHVQLRLAVTALRPGKPELKTQDSSLALPRTSSVPLGMLLHLSVPWLPQPPNEEGIFLVGVVTLSKE